jgi:hypothetical protein
MINVIKCIKLNIPLQLPPIESESAIKKLKSLNSKLPFSSSKKYLSVSNNPFSSSLTVFCRAIEE